VAHRAERLSAVVAGSAAVFALSGCGSASDAQSASTTAATGRTKASAPAQPAQSTSQAPVQSDREVFESTFFLSPDGNIACNIEVDMGVRCDIIDANWPRPVPPADCQDSYGHMIAINPSIGLGKPAEFICAGDTVFGSDEPLPDGESITSGAFRCDSADSGIACRNTETGHGFSISRDAYQLF
jgi:hypothetical protein